MTVYLGKQEGWLVTEEMKGCHPKHPTYPLLPNDLLIKEPDGTYSKFNGVGIFGFVLTPEQEATLKWSDDRGYVM